MARATVLTVVAALLLSLVQALATDRFVDMRAPVAIGPGCLDPAHPCVTLHQALGAAASGDTIKVAGGHGRRYRETLRIDTPETLTLIGGYDPAFTEPPDPAVRPTVLDAAHRDRGLTVVAEAGETVAVTFDGFVVQHGVPASNLSQLFCCIGKGGGIAAFAEDGGTVNLTVRRTAVTGSRSADSAGGVVIMAYASGTTTATLDRVRITKNRAPYQGGIGVQSIGGGSASHVTVTIENAIVADNRCDYDGGGIGVSAYGGGSTSDVSLVNATVTRNRTAGEEPEYPEPVGGGGLSIIGVDSPVHVTLRNTIVWGNAARAGTGRDLHTEMFGPAAPSVDVDHTDFGDAALLAGPVTDLGGNVSVDPKLASGFELSNTSPIIDAGTCTGAPPRDIDGDPRPSGAGCDIGADEVQF